MMSDTSVIIVSYNTGAALWICLYRVLQLEDVKEIILVNNGNEAVTELRLRQLEKDEARFRLITGQGNVGFSKGCNLGAEQATSDYLLFLNPDAILMAENAISHLSVLFREQRHPPVGLVGGILRNDDGSEQRASRRNIITPQNALTEGFNLHRLEGLPLPVINLERTSLPDMPVPIGAISGACMMMERERFVQVGKFNEDYFLHVEDMDLCLRVYKAGGSVWVNPRIDILHFRSTSLIQALFIERMKARGFVRYFALHFDANPIWRSIAQICAYLNLGAKIFKSLFDEFKTLPLLTDAKGIRRVQAIVRGMDAAETGKNEGSGRTILVTGASSPVGLFTIGRLLAQGYRVVAIVKHTLVGFFHPHLTWIKADLTDAEVLATRLQHFSCEAVIHCAPVWLAAKVLPVFCGIGTRKIVAISSTSVLTKMESESKSEQLIAKQLQAGEEALKGQAVSLGVTITLLRPTMIYGAGLDKNVTRIAEKIDGNGVFYLEKPAKGLRAPVHADDLAQAAIGAINNPDAAGKTYTVQGGESLSYYHMVERIGRILEKPFKIRSILGLSNLCRLLHPFWPRIIPHASVAMRMQQDNLFPDERIASELGVTPRAFLSGGLLDVGLCPEAICRKLLDMPRASK